MPEPAVPMRRPILLISGCLTAGLMGLASQPARSSAPEPLATPMAAAPDREGVEFFETRIRPVLVEQCVACHGAKKAWGGLRLDTPASLRKGGEGGPLFLAGKPKESRLLKALRHEGGMKTMPPQGKLPEKVVADFQGWIERGAPLPAVPQAAVRSGIDLAAGRKHWAFQPLRERPSPKVSAPSWARRKIDAFILAGLAARKFQPSPQADRRTLLRRITFALTGLSPTVEEVEAFVKDPSPNAYERQVERLLASPQYGERWARHWLDVARYAEDNPTSEASNPPPSYPWRYRDWVVKALNEDLPYREFLRRQIAADLIPGIDPSERAALGFLGLAPVYHKELMLARDVIETIAADEWDERLDTMTRGVLGLTVACARCHDHKFDPISTKDYYALAGVMASTQLLEWPLAEMPVDQAEKLSRAERSARDMERDLRRKRRERSDANMAQQIKLDAEIAELETKIEQTRKSVPGFGTPIGSIVRDAGLWVDGKNKDRTDLDYRPGISRDLPVFIRGNVARPGEVVPRRFLAVLSAGEPRPFGPGSGRRELADAMVGESAPLTARVMVNRVWGWHFGRPLVTTPSNFGILGDKPTHPELMEDLAARFVKNGWSLKWLHREIVLSATYQQVSKTRADDARRDAENRWLSRMNRLRLEPEAWRDAILQIAGQLDLTPGGPSEDLDGLNNKRRTLYGRVSRQRQPDILRLFDFPDPNRHGEQRTPTTTPVQQLYFLNSPFIQRHADLLAVQAVGEGAGSASGEGARSLFRRTLLRDPSPREVETTAALAPGGTRTEWSVVAQALLASNEFLFVD